MTEVSLNRPGPFAAVPAGGFRCLLSAATVSNFGDGLRLIALPLLTIRVTRDPTQVAVVTCVGYLPWVLFSIPAGVIVERHGQRRLMVLLNVARAALLAGLVTVIGMAGATIALLAVISFVLAVSQTLYDSAAHTLLPALLPAERLSYGNERLSLSQTLMRQFIAPPAGAVMFTLAPVFPLAVDAATFAAAALLLALPAMNLVPARPRSTPARRKQAGVIRDMRGGLAIVWHSPLLRALCGMYAVWNLTLGAVLGIVALWAREVLGLGPVGYSLLFAGSALGGILGAIAAPRCTKRIGTGRSMQLAFAGLIATFAAMGLTSQPVVAAALLALDGLLTVLWNVVTVSMRQSVVPAEMLGRIQGVFQTCSRGVMPAGALLGGLVSAVLGLRAPFLLGAACFLIFVPLLPALSDRQIAQTRQALSRLAA
jgi:MFS family permease